MGDELIKSGEGGKMVKVSYDYKWDILYIHKEGNKAKFSVEAFDNFVVDIGFDGRVVGLEILDASKELKIAKKDLKDIKSARLATVVKGKLYGVMYSFKFRDSTLESELRIPAMKGVLAK